MDGFIAAESGKNSMNYMANWPRLSWAQISVKKTHTHTHKAMDGVLYLDTVRPCQFSAI